jgi:hypothetical protein
LITHAGRAVAVLVRPGLALTLLGMFPIVMIILQSVNRVTKKIFGVKIGQSEPTKATDAAFCEALGKVYRM